MSARCDVVHSRDCDGQCNTMCFRCGLPACRSCSVVIDYKRYGKKRIGLNCLEEMARFNELDHLTLTVQG